MKRRSELFLLADGPIRCSNVHLMSGINFFIDITHGSKMSADKYFIKLNDNDKFQDAVTIQRLHGWHKKSKY